MAAGAAGAAAAAAATVATIAVRARQLDAQRKDLEKREVCGVGMLAVVVMAESIFSRCLIWVSSEKMGSISQTTFLIAQQRLVAVFSEFKHFRHRR